MTDNASRTCGRGGGSCFADPEFLIDMVSVQRPGVQVGSSAQDTLVIDPAHQFALAIRAHPEGFRLVGVRHPERTALEASLATQGTVMQLGTWHRAGESPIPRAFQEV